MSIHIQDYKKPQVIEKILKGAIKDIFMITKYQINVIAVESYYPIRLLPFS